MCLLIAVNERFKSFRKPERLEIALHTLNNVIYDLIAFTSLYLYAYSFYEMQVKCIYV
jgi:hypothetical protein